MFWEEPLARSHPIRSLDNVVLTPHPGLCHRGKPIGVSIARSWRISPHGWMARRSGWSDEARRK